MRAYEGGMMIFTLRKLKCVVWFEPQIRFVRLPLKQAIHLMVENIYLKKKVEHPISTFLFPNHQKNKKKKVKHLLAVVFDKQIRYIN